MKAPKFLIGLLAITSAFTFVSCNSNDEMSEIAAPAEQTVTFTTALPAEIFSRANNSALSSSVYADGTKATTLYYAVYTYTEDSNTLVLTNYGKEGDNAYVKDDVKFVNLYATVKFTLANGNPYKFVFWAQADEADYYTFDPATGDINIDYSKVTCNDDLQDAFYACVSYTFAQGSGQSVTLTRPFAQLNVGLTDYDRAKELGMELAETSLSVYKVPTTMNLISGDVPEPNGDNADKYTDVLFKYNVTPAKQANAGRFPAKENGEYVDAEYEAMAYVLVTKKTYDMQFNYKSTTGVTKSFGFFEIPMEPNHRTNIYGGLLLTDQEWTIQIDNTFIEPDYNETTEDFIEM